jgi:hypothetical protein
VQAIKAKCRDCYGTTIYDVRTCSGLKLMDGPCSLHQFRMGTNPNVSAETRARQREAMERRLLVEKGQRSPMVDVSGTGGRVFVHPEELGLEIDNPLFDPVTAGDAVHAGR